MYIIKLHKLETKNLNHKKKKKKKGADPSSFIFDENIFAIFSKFLLDRAFIVWPHCLYVSNYKCQ